MVQKVWTGNIAIIMLALVNVALWFAFTPVNDGTWPGYNLQLPAEIISSTAMVLMSTALFISARPRYMEPFFGGLDKMYQSHKNAALASLVLIVSHFMVVPKGGGLSDAEEAAGAVEEVRLSSVVEFLVEIFGMSPVMEVLGETLGLVAFAGFLVLILLSVAPRLPLIGHFTRFSYGKWKWTHKFIGLFFIVGFAHSLTVDSLVLHAPVPLVYLTAAAAIGTVCYLYSEIFSILLIRRFPFTVESVQRLNGTTVEVALRPEGRKPGFTAGQFAYVSFPGVRGLGEPHPFTVACSPREDNLRFAIKASGDWTRHLNANLGPGARARVDGCYGRFDYRAGGREQIWIAGGIGITPFMAWIRDFYDGPNADVDMFYTVRSPGDLLFADEITSAARSANFRPHIRISSEDGNLTVDQVASLCQGNIGNKHIYMCGPIGMMVAMEREFKRRGVPGKNIHYEEFNFR